MLSRSFPRVIAKRVVTPAAVTAIRPFSKVGGRNNAEVVSAETVPVITYADGVRAEHMIPPQEPAVVKPPGVDVQKHAVALDPSILSRLTPTMKKFTLTDKVAVITGSV